MVLSLFPHADEVRHVGAARSRLIDAQGVVADAPEVQPARAAMLTREAGRGVDRQAVARAADQQSDPSPFQECRLSGHAVDDTQKNPPDPDVSRSRGGKTSHRNQFAHFDVTGQPLELTQESQLGNRWCPRSDSTDPRYGQ